MALLQTALKLALSAGIAVAVAEIAKRSNFWAAALASLPLTSILALVWLYVDTGDTARVANLATSILWLVVPSLLFFILLPLLLRAQWGFGSSLTLAAGATALAYVATVKLLTIIGIEI